MRNEITALAAQINREHELAEKHAREAVNYALRAGELLMEVKAQLPHGEFTAWV